MDVYSKARDLGIELEFRDGQGERHAVSVERVRAVLDGLPAPAQHLYLKQPVVIAENSDDFRVAIDGAANGLRWRLVECNEVRARGRVADAAIDLPRSIAIGTYWLELEDKSGNAIDSTTLLLAPPAAYQGAFDRVWLLSVQLYGLSSSRNWGIGDFTDLATLIDLSANWGCAGIGLNPLHALFDDVPLQCSPYAPNSRLFLNPLYIDPERLPNFPRGWMAQHGEKLEAARKGALVDYVAVAELKLAALQHAFSTFGEQSDGYRKFEAFRQERGVLLQRFACFEVLRKQFGSLPWWQWPEEWRRPDDAQIRAFRSGPRRAEVEYVEYVQWCAASQLKSCADLAASRGMAVGLYLDVAVGVQAGGFDAWNEQGAISRALSVGAPPDLLNTAGQDWGLAGFNSAGLEASEFAPFREMVRASMRFAGAIRLDHVLGLNRLYLIPSGSSPHDGVYVEMPLSALLAVVAQESVSQNCITIGEDLGTVPDGFRDILARWGVWSYSVMMFERGHDGAFLGSSDYTTNALVTFNTHDLASFAGWQSHHDLSVKRELGMDPGETDEERAQAVRSFEWKLGEEHIAPKNFFGAVEFLARSRSRILALAIEDLLGLKDQPNIPGTVDEHPNWRRRLPVDLDDLTRRIDIEALRRALGSRGNLPSGQTDHSRHGLREA